MQCRPSRNVDVVDRGDVLRPDELQWLRRRRTILLLLLALLRCIGVRVEGHRRRQGGLGFAAEGARILAATSNGVMVDGEEGQSGHV